MDQQSMRVRAFGVFILVFCAAALPAWARQNQNSSPYGSPDEPAASSQSTPNQPQDQQQNQQQGRDAAPPQPSQQEPQSAPAHATALPVTLTVAAGVLSAVR